MPALKIDRAAAVKAWLNSLAAVRIQGVTGEGCWVWAGALDPAGYGSVWCDGKSRKAHRVSYTATVGPIPNGLPLDHLCRNPACVRPDHLEPVEHRTNVLRGAGPTAANSAKKICPRGHPLEGENLVPSALRRGHRTCRKCSEQSNRERHALVAAACRILGLTYAEYRARYGQSRHVAESILRSKGVE